MKALYTETFGDFLERNESSEIWQAIVTKFAKFPTFNLQLLNFSMYDLFKEKYDVREIGAETESLFVHFVNDKLNEVLVQYAPKINLYLENFSKLLDRKITLANNSTDTRVMDRTINTTDTGDITHDDNENKSTYLNPINAVAGTGSDRTATRDNVTRDNTETHDLATDVDEDSTYTLTYYGSREQALLFFKSNPDLWLLHYIKVADLINRIVKC